MGKDYLMTSIYGAELKRQRNEVNKAKKGNPKGTSHIPYTMMNSIDNKMTQMRDGNIVPQNKKDRPAKYQPIKKTFKELVHIGMNKLNDKHISNEAL